MCGSGHHRSVAFAEELRRRDWPGEWKVEVSHRDVTSEVFLEKSIARDKKRRLGQELGAVREFKHPASGSEDEHGEILHTSS